MTKRQKPLEQVVAEYYMHLAEEEQLSRKRQKYKNPYTPKLLAILISSSSLCAQVLMGPQPS